MQLLAAFLIGVVIGLILAYIFHEALYHAIHRTPKGVVGSVKSRLEVKEEE